MVRPATYGLIVLASRVTRGLAPLMWSAVAWYRLGLGFALSVGSPKKQKRCEAIALQKSTAEKGPGPFSRRLQEACLSDVSAVKWQVCSDPQIDSPLSEHHVLGQRRGNREGRPSELLYRDATGNGR